MLLVGVIKDVFENLRMHGMEYFKPSRFTSTHLMAYSKVKLKSNGDKTSPCFKPLRTGSAGTDKYRGINCKTKNFLLLQGFSIIELVNYSLIVLSLQGIIPHSCYSDNLRH